MSIPDAPACYLRAAYRWQLTYHVKDCPACQDWLRHMTQFAANTTHPELSIEELEAA